jgi:hypothetical protein
MLRSAGVSRRGWAIAMGVAVVVIAGLFPAVAGARTLAPGNWDPEIRAKLIALVERHKNQNEHAFFDWDNTSQCRDIGNATLAQLVADGQVQRQNIPDALFPPYTYQGQRYTADDPWNYYNTFAEVAPYNQGGIYDVLYSLFTNNLTVGQVNRATERAYANGAGRRDIGQPRTVEPPILPGAQRPFVYPEMADLYGYLMDRGIHVWVISASQIWTVRWIVKHALNPMIKRRWARATRSRCRGSSARRACSSATTGGSSSTRTSPATAAGWKGT